MSEKAHIWVPSTLGHGNAMCCRCYTTDLEATAMGEERFCRSNNFPTIPWRGSKKRLAERLNRAKQEGGG